MTTSPRITRCRPPAGRATSWVVTAAGGYGLIELLVTLSIFTIIAGIAMPEIRAARMQVGNAQRLLIANLRLARANAISKSIHYQVTFPTANQIVVSRMNETPVGSGTWLVDTTTQRTIAVPSPAFLKSTVVGTTYEFTTRGLVVNLNAPVQLDAQDTYGMTKSLQIWPSGQINEL